MPRTVMWPVRDQTVTVSSAASAALWTPSSLMWISCASRDVSVALVNVEEDVTHEVEGGCRVLPCSGALSARDLDRLGQGRRHRREQLDRLPHAAVDVEVPTGNPEAARRRSRPCVGGPPPAGLVTSGS